MDIKRGVKIMMRVAVVIGGVIILFVLFFNRAPDRVIPESGIVSAASGRIIEIKQLPNTDVVFQKQGITNQVSVPEINGPVSVVVIEMTPLDVHVQRAPVDGEIIRMEHYDGHHRNALGGHKLDLITENEKVVTVFQNNDRTVGVVQVAGVAARRIKNNMSAKSIVQKGDQYGRIILGSQVVMIIPQEDTVLANVGDRVIDGETVIAR